MKTIRFRIAVSVKTQRTPILQKNETMFLSSSRPYHSITIWYWFYIVCIVFSTACTQSTSNDIPPNIIIILTDDQGWGDLGYHGNTNLSTPHIDSLALQGAVFENFYVQPVCSPTRAELLTGQYFPKMGGYDTSAGGERMKAGVTTIANTFQRAGYVTALYGKWHNGMQPPYHPNSRGFDDFYGFASGHWGNYFDPMLEHNGKVVRGKGFLVDDLFRHGMDFITQNRKKPFFLMLPVNTPHSPMQVPDNYWDKFKGKTLTMRYGGPEREDINFTKAALAMVENIDWNVGRLTKHLRNLQLEENTMVVYLSDNGANGWRWNGGLKGRKGSTDEGGVKSPLFIKWPKRIDAGLRFGQLLGAVDLFPTLANLASVSLADTLNIDGINYGQSIRKGNDDRIHRIIYNHWNGKTSVRSQRYRLDHKNRLYHIETDKGQLHDLSQLHPKIVDSLSNLRQQWLGEVAPYVDRSRKKPFTIGHPHHKFTHIPARDGMAHGSIQRSNRWPNDSFFTNWTHTSDAITWNVAVLSDGIFDVTLYYTCKPENVGTKIELSLADASLETTITDSHDPQLMGMENDRFPRMESYIKDFKPLSMGHIKLKKGKARLTLRATEIPGKGAIDFRLLVFERLSP
ncbi:MAG: arylsulfatase [Flavobacteriaceae bacterium]